MALTSLNLGRLIVVVKLSDPRPVFEYLFFRGNGQN